MTSASNFPLRKCDASMTSCSTSEHKACTTQRTTTMLLEPSSGSTVHQDEHANPEKAFRKNKRRRRKGDPAPSSSAQVPQVPIPGTFAYLPPEIRNIIYALIFENPSDLNKIAAEGSDGQFKLARPYCQPQYDALVALRAHCIVRQKGFRPKTTRDGMADQLRLEARTYFYASQRFRVLSYGFEYLPLYVRWLEAIGPECRVVLRSVALAGCMWYKPAEILTMQLHTLLQNCESLISLTIELNIRHLYEKSPNEIKAFLESAEETSSNEMVPHADVGTWVGTIKKIPALKKFILQLGMGIDKRQESKYRKFEVSEIQKGRLIAREVERQLGREVSEMSGWTELVIGVEYVGRYEQRYGGLPW